MNLEQLKELRKEKNLTQKELAEKLHVPVKTLQNWEQGRTKPSRITEAAIEALLLN